MKKISDMVSVTQFEKYSNETNVTTIDDEKTKKILNRLFTRFERIFPKFWVNIKSQEHLNGIKDEWFECFKKARITDIKLIQVGLQKAQSCNEDYLPKASKFIQWCIDVNPQELGFPEIYEAFNIALSINRQFSEYTHPDCKVDTVIRHAINQIGSMNFREMNQHKAIKAFEYNYSIACRQYIEGNLQDISKALPEKPAPHPVDKVKNDEARKIAMAKMRSALGM